MWNLPRFRRSVRLSGHLGIDPQQTICPFVIAGRLPGPGPSSAGARPPQSGLASWYIKGGDVAHVEYGSRDLHGLERPEPA